jgi:hypothetical protein
MSKTISQRASAGAIVARFHSLERELDRLEAAIEKTPKRAPALAQALKLVAIDLARQARTIHDGVASSVVLLRHLDGKTTEENRRLAEIVEMAKLTLLAGLSDMGITEEAIAPYLEQANTVFLNVVAQLSAEARRKLEQAEAIAKSVL